MRDQVESDYFEGFRVFWYWDPVQWCFPRMSLRFVLLTRPAPFDVFGDPRSHAWPLVAFHYLFVRLVSSQVSCCWGVVVEP